MPLLLKPPTAKTFWKKSATLQVALAEVMGNPKNVRIGTENSDPPPPTVFRNDARKPVNIMTGILYSSK